MATLISKQTGNFTAAGTWGVVDTTTFLDSEANNTALTTSYVASAGTTPGAITVEGIAVKIFSRNASPTGTMSVDLAVAGVQVAGTEVTTDVTDLPIQGWVFFKFSAPVLLLAATAYTVRAKTSSSSMVNLYRNATANNWSRMLRTTTTAAPAATDSIHVMGDYTGTSGAGSSYTVTFDNTAATNFGTTTPPQSLTVNKRGTMTCGTSAATNYVFTYTGIQRVFDGGVLNWGTSSARIPSNSSVNIVAVQAANVDSGIQIASGGILRMYGDNSVTNLKTQLTSNVGVAGTTCDVLSTTGWAGTNQVVFAPTAATPSQFEKRTINTIVSGTQFTVTAGLTNAHSGSSPTRGYVGLLTRNVKFHGESATQQAFIKVETGGQIEIDFAEIYNLGSSTTNKRGIEHESSVTSFITNSSIYDCSTTGSAGFMVGTSTANNFTVQSNIFYNCSSHSILLNTALTGTSYVIDDNLVIGTGATGGASGIQLSDVGGTITNNIVSGSTSGSGIAFAESGGLLGSISGNVCHTNNTSGISNGGVLGTVTNSTTWRNTQNGIVQTSGETIYDGHTSFGNTIANFSISGGVATVNSPVWNAGTTQVCPVGLALAGSGKVMINDGSSGSSTAHGTGDINVSGINHYNEVYLNNFIMASGVEVANQTNLAPFSYIGANEHDGTEGNNRAWRKYGNYTIDTTILDATPSLRMTPSSASQKLVSPFITVPCLDGQAVSVSIKVRESVVGDGTAYNGAFPRLIVRKNVSVGVSADTVLATATSASEGAFETLTGTTVVPNADGVLEFYIDCDGTTGWVNVDTFNVTSNPNDTRGYKFWADGSPVVYGNNSTGGGSFAFTG